jgi:hypothetical protein
MMKTPDEVVAPSSGSSVAAVDPPPEILNAQVHMLPRPATLSWLNAKAEPGMTNSAFESNWNVTLKSLL